MEASVEGLLTCGRFNLKVGELEEWVCGWPWLAVPEDAPNVLQCNTARKRQEQPTEDEILSGGGSSPVCSGDGGPGHGVDVQCWLGKG